MRDHWLTFRQYEYLFRKVQFHQEYINYYKEKLKLERFPAYPIYPARSNELRNEYGHNKFYENSYEIYKLFSYIKQNEEFIATLGPMHIEEVRKVIPSFQNMYEGLTKKEYDYLFRTIKYQKHCLQIIDKAMDVFIDDEFYDDSSDDETIHGISEEEIEEDVNDNTNEEEIEEDVNDNSNEEEIEEDVNDNSNEEEIEEDVNEIPKPCVVREVQYHPSVHPIEVCDESSESEHSSTSEEALMTENKAQKSYSNYDIAFMIVFFILWTIRTAIEGYIIFNE